MDNMRHLSTSLPRARRGKDQSHELLASFKAAALSVTTLYKTAAADQARARAGGYQDALDDLLAFLDRENLGLMDGEGWKVRQWATERLDDGPQRQTAGSDDDEIEAREEAEETRSASPESQSKSTVPATTRELSEAPSPQRASIAEPPSAIPQPASQPLMLPPSLNDFAFRSRHAYPTKHDREGTMEIDHSQTPIRASTPTRSSTPRTTPRASRNKHHRRENKEGRATLNLNLGGGAGSKRKIPYPDFFDISGVNFDGQNYDRKDSGGRGGKRGKYV